MAKGSISRQGLGLHTSRHSGMMMRMLFVMMGSDGWRPHAAGDPRIHAGNQDGPAPGDGTVSSQEFQAAHEGIYKAIVAAAGAAVGSRRG
jgi:hypothetical protein